VAATPLPGAPARSPLAVLGVLTVWIQPLRRSVAGSVLGPGSSVGSLNVRTSWKPEALDVPMAT
jgi:hypothetical protein